MISFHIAVSFNSPVSTGGSPILVSLNSTVYKNSRILFMNKKVIKIIECI